MDKPKKCCMYCGCYLDPYSDSDVCEICFDERYLDDILIDLDEEE